MGIKKMISLRAAFWRFLLLLLGGLSGAVALPYMILAKGIGAGMVTYANSSEAMAKEIAPILAAAPDLTKVQLPVGIKYLLMDKNYQQLGTTLEGEELKQALEYAATGLNKQNWDEHYLFVARQEEYIVLQYYIGSRFTNTWMNEHLPSPEKLTLVWAGVNCMLVCIFLTTAFAKRLGRQLAPLFEATAGVAEQNLDFEVGHSKIKEFEEVLSSFSDMKEGLKEALEQQWRAEQLQREQIAALAHDLKTPLTVVQGNADLILETGLNEEQHKYAGYIADSAEQMQLYIRTLIDIARTASGYRLSLEELPLVAYLEQIKAQSNALCGTRGVGLRMMVSNIPVSIQADGLLLERAIMNVVNNALDYSPKDGLIHICVTGGEDKLDISVTDQGEGFSREAILHAQEQFYMADRSRGKKHHFGMGLYITKTILEQHGGRLILENVTETGGARVVLAIPTIPAKRISVENVY